MQLIQAKADVDVEDFTGRTSLCFAAEMNNTEIALRLIQAKANVNAYACAVRLGGTPLLYAAQGNNTVLVLKPIQAKADVDMKGQASKPLHGATKKNSAEVALQLIQAKRAKSDVDVKDQDQNTPLHIAAQWNSAELALQLIQAKADVDVKDVNQKPLLHVAAEKNSTEVALQLIQAKSRC